MRLDKDLMFSDAQAITDVGTTASTNDINLVAAGDADKELFLEIRVDTNAASAGGGSLTFALVTDESTTFDSAKTLWQSGALAATDLTVGKKFRTRIPRGMEEALRVNYIVAGAAFEAGKYVAYLTDSIDTNH